MTPAAEAGRGVRYDNPEAQSTRRDAALNPFGTLCLCCWGVRETGEQAQL